MRWSPIIPAQKIYRTSSLCCTTSYCMRVLLHLHMGVMCVENSFPCEGCFIGNQHFSREKGICKTLSKVLLSKSNSSCIIIRLQYLGTLHMKLMHVCSQRILQTLERETVTACAILRVLLLGVSCICCSTIFSMTGVRAVFTRSLPALWNKPVSANFWCRLAKKKWLGIRLLWYRSTYKSCVAHNAYRLTQSPYNQPSY